MKTYVCGFMFNSKETHVALVEKAKPDWQRGLLNGIGGKIERGETPLMAMVREFKEETEVKTSKGDWEQVHTLNWHNLHSGEDHRVYFYKTFVSRMMRLWGTPVEPVGWYKILTLNRSGRLTLPNLKWIIPFALHAGTITPPILTEEVHA